MTFCQERERNLENVVSSSLIRLPGTVCRLICTTSQALTRPRMAQDVLANVGVRYTLPVYTSREHGFPTVWTAVLAGRVHGRRSTQPVHTALERG